ncbi:hypothetical protein A3C96_04270 [Candidatus Uhrbacteria bacterium RIFCSPHIGHO2_02_FULL_60_10]|uniref:EamA domain-containing protein n=1 Tax=Candidatus Uhrbacteria bacterium RIFCSPHIGHO2_02_FULL_60_10 TaxID=1802392 RepID=A0A1F7U8R5_9BACT|nr:MAG: hypothetical protein A3C96_04270 [Candidatus Uhrbacteria bacterium RIFCSPHIGHO2_02_FULL_60_10]
MNRLTNNAWRFGVGLALSAAFISGTNNFLTKIATTAVKDPVTYTALKNLLVALLFVAIAAGSGVWSEVRALSRRQALTLLAIGIFGGGIPFLLYFTGLTATAAINASLIHKTMFLWVLLLAVPLRKERISLLLAAGAVLLFTANLFVGGFKGFRFNSGEVMILAATLMWAVESLVAKSALAGLSARLVATARMSVGALLLVAVSLSRGGLSAVSAMSPTAWSWTILTSILLAGYVLCWYSALKRLPATVTAALLVPATLVTNLLAAGFLTHALPTRDIVSATLFVAGTAVIIAFVRRPPENVGVECKV